MALLCVVAEQRDKLPLAIGGWFGIATAVVAWYTALAGLLRSMSSPYQLPMGWVH